MPMSCPNIYDPPFHQSDRHSTMYETHIHQRSTYIRLRGVNTGNLGNLGNLPSRSEISIRPQEQFCKDNPNSEPTVDTKPLQKHSRGQPTNQQPIKRLGGTCLRWVGRKFVGCALYEIIAVVIYSYLDTFSRATSISLNRPSTLAMMLAMMVLELMTKLPRLITHVLVPLFCAYLVFHVGRCVLKEYEIFLGLGKGGVPSTPRGFLKVSILKFMACVDVLDAPRYDTSFKPSQGQLYNLAKRSGVRPCVQGVAPQRQFDQKGPSGTFNQLQQLLRDTSQGEENLKMDISYLEGHTDALKAAFIDTPTRICDTDGEWDFEIAHAHEKDGSMHMILHPADVKAVIAAGWGERHPLSNDTWWWKSFWHTVMGRRRPTPPNLVLIYSPRSAWEFGTVKQILGAAVWFHKKRHEFEQLNGSLATQAHGAISLARTEVVNGNRWNVDSKSTSLVVTLDTK